MRDGELRTPLGLSLIQKIGHDLLLGGSLGHKLDLSAEGQILPGYRLQEIGHHPVMELTGIAAHGQHPLTVQPQDLTPLQGKGTHRHGLHPGAGKGLAENFSRLDHSQDTAGPVVIIPDHLDRPFQGHPDKTRRVTLQKDRLPLGDLPLPGSQTVEHEAHFLRDHPGKQRTAGKNGKIFFHFPLLCWISNIHSIHSIVILSHKVKNQEEGGLYDD